MVLAYIKEGGYDYVNGLIELDLNKTLGLKFSSDLLKIEKIHDEINNYISKIDEFNFTNYNKFHFSFYYGLIKDSQLELGYSNIEKIDGWATIEKCSLDIPNEKFILKFKDINDDFIPKKLCGQFLDNNANLISTKEKDFKKINDVILTSSSTYTYRYSDLNEVKSKALSKVGNGFQSINGEQKEFCKSIVEKVSRIRIPFPSNIPKKGGGIRVKRILFKDNFDNLTKGHSERIYGKEYIYENEEGKTSGVVSNEPPILGNENSLMKSYEKRNEKAKARISRNLKTKYADKTRIEKDEMREQVRDEYKVRLQDEPKRFIKKRISDTQYKKEVEKWNNNKPQKEYNYNTLRNLVSKEYELGKRILKRLITEDDANDIIVSYRKMRRYGLQKANLSQQIYKSLIFDNFFGISYVKDDIVKAKSVFDKIKNLF
jgi:hypothetical protein